MGPGPGVQLRTAGRQLPPFVSRLVAWAETQFRRLKPLPDGGTLGDAFVSYRKETGKAHPEDRDYIEPPVTMLYLYSWFWEIGQGRPCGPEGTALPIPPSELLAWATLGGHTLTEWELQSIRALDGAFLKVAAEKV